MMKLKQLRSKQGLAGIATLVVAAVWLTIIAPNILALPENFSFSAQIVSVDNFYDESEQKYSGEQYSSTTYDYSTVSTAGRAATIQNSFHVRTHDGQPIFSVERTYGIDRKSLAHIPNAGDRVRSGYLFAPRHLRAGQAFTYWHVNYDGPAEMQYAGSEYLHGLRTYKYTSSYPGVPIDQTEQLTSLPEVGLTRGVEVEPQLNIWVEPVTGRLIKYADDSVAYYYDLATRERLNPWNHFSNTFDEQSVEQIVQQVRSVKTATRTIELYVPLVLFVVGILFVLRDLGITALLLRRRPGKYLGRVGGSLIAFSGAVILVGWTIRSMDLVRFFQNGAVVTPLAALLFLLLGVAAVLVPVLRGKLSAFIGTAIITFALIQILDYVGVTQINIERLFFPQFLMQTGAQTSLLTDVLFLLLGLSLTTLVFRRFRNLPVAGLLSATGVLLSSLVIIGYMFEASEILSYSFFDSPALLTVCLLSFSSIVIFFSNRDAQPRSFQITTNILLFSIFFIFIVGSIFFTTLAEQVTTKEAQAKFREQTANIEQSISERFKVNVGLLDGARGLLAASQSVERNEWEAYVDGLNLHKNYPGIQGIGYSIFITPEQLAQHEAAIQAEGFPDYRVFPAGERDRYSSIIYIEPFDQRNQRAFGFDMYQDATRRDAMNQARDSGQPTMTRKVVLVQEFGEDVQPGFVVVTPVYVNGQPTDTLEQRRDNIIGFVYGPFRARNFVEAAINQIQNVDVALEIYNGTSIAEADLIFDNRPSHGLNERPRFEEIRTVYAAGRPWTLHFSSSSNFGQTPFSRALPLLVLAAGIMVSFLTITVIYSLISTRQRAIALADELTKDLLDAQKIGRFGNFVFNFKTNSAEWSDESFRMHGLTPNKDHHAPSSEQHLAVIHRDDLAAARASIQQAAKSTGNYQYVYRAVWPDGSIHFIRVRSKLSRDKDGNPEVMKGTFQDITKDQEIAQMKSDFVSLVSHQLKTPSGIINGYAENLLDGLAGPLTDRQREYLLRIADVANRNYSLIANLLNVSRIERGVIQVDLKATKLQGVLENALSDYKETAKSRGLELKIEPAALDVTVMCDELKLTECIKNAINNALKFTRTGGIYIKVKRQENVAQIDVVDTGSGISADVMKKLFTRDEVLSGSPSPDGSSGLGLYITKSFMRLQHGDVTVSSKVGEGSTFTFTIPLA